MIIISLFMTKSLSNEEKYQGMEHHEHVLRRPDMYIGSVDKEIQKLCVYDFDTNMIIEKEIEYIPGLYKIFDEIIVNARDHSVGDPTCKNIRISIDKNTGIISCCNDGDDMIPIQIHKTYNKYIPEFIFSNLLSSTNYDDECERITGGKNGLGAKCTNIYSKWFKITVVNKKDKLQYEQLCHENMYKIDEPVITSITKKLSSSVTLEFLPDYKKFGVDGISDDMFALFYKRVYDIALCTNSCVNIYLNEKKIDTKNLVEYIKMYYNHEVTPVYHEEFLNYKSKQGAILPLHWKIGAIFDPDNGYRHFSYVNGIYTPLGGSHVEEVRKKIMDKIIKHFEDKKKVERTKVSKFIKSNLTLFIDCTIINPKFTSQTKEFMASSVTDYKLRCNIPDNFVKDFMTKEFIEDVMSKLEFDENRKMERSVNGTKKKKLKGMKKLADAHRAGTQMSKYCSLLLTEGDSAKPYAIAGREVIGSEYFGVFPLKGKLINTRKNTRSKVLKNTEIRNIMQIIGLELGVEYTEENISTLRYGSIIILTDQDYDGFHIKGLIINFIGTFWPSLLKIKGFIKCFETPIVRAWKKQNDRKDVIKFYNVNDFEKWLDATEKKSEWEIKYFKGLGTSDPDTDAVEDFESFNDTILSYYDAEKDAFVPEKCVDRLDLAFGKEHADERKEWIKSYNPENRIDKTSRMITISDVIDKEVLEYSFNNIIRSIPSVCDGLKPSQRKIIYGAFKKNLIKKEIKVSQLAGIVSAESAYHHGEESLNGAIVKLAQDFLGTNNNINVLFPSGNFGSRRGGGNDHSSARYIYTRLEDLTPIIFNKLDNYILDYQEDDGKKVEPVVYSPILPLILVNGTIGVGTGYSTNIPSFDPIDIIANIKRILNKEPYVEMRPWFKGFKGTVKKIKTNNYETIGNFTINGNKVHVTELPVGVWTEEYLDMLEDLESDSKELKDNPNILSKKPLAGFIENCGNNSIDIVIEFHKGELQKLIKGGMQKVITQLKLSNKFTTSNMHAFNKNHVITKYDTPEDILKEFIAFRLNVYEKRKEFFSKLLKYELDVIKYKIKFIDLVTDEVIDLFERVNNKRVTRNRDALEQDLIANKFPKFYTDAYMKSNDPHKEGEATFNYIFGMNIGKLTKEEKEELEKKYKEKLAEYKKYMNTPIEQLWLEELLELEQKYPSWLEKSLQKKQRNDKKKIKKKGGPKRKQK